MVNDDEVLEHTEPTDLDRLPVLLKRGAFELRFQMSCHSTRQLANLGLASHSEPGKQEDESEIARSGRFIPPHLLLTSDFSSLIEEFLMTVHRLFPANYRMV